MSKSFDNLTYDSNFSNETNDGPIAPNLTLLPFKICFWFCSASFNITIILILTLKFKKKSYSDMLYLSSTMSDCVAGVSSIAFMTVYTTYGYWPLGYSPCVFWVINDYSVSSISLYSVLLMTIHRYRVLTNVHTTDEMTKLRIFNILTIWLLNYCFWATSVLYITSKDFEPANCYYTYTFAYVFTSDFVTYVTPIICMTVLNGFVLFELYKKGKKFGNKDRVGVVASSAITATEDQVSSVMASNNQSNTKQTVTSQKKKLAKEKRAFICQFCVGFNLIMCWTLFIVTWPIAAYCPSCISALVSEVSYWAAYFASLTNPILLVIFHRKINQHLFGTIKKIFTGKTLTR